MVGGACCIWIGVRSAGPSPSFVVRYRRAHRGASFRLVSSERRAGRRGLLSVDSEVGGAVEEVMEESFVLGTSKG